MRSAAAGLATALRSLARRGVGSSAQKSEHRREGSLATRCRWHQRHEGETSPIQIFVHIHVQLPSRQDAQPPVPWRHIVEGADKSKICLFGWPDWTPCPVEIWTPCPGPSLPRALGPCNWSVINLSLASTIVRNTIVLGGPLIVSEVPWE